LKSIVPLSIFFGDAERMIDRILSLLLDKARWKKQHLRQVAHGAYLAKDFFVAVNKGVLRIC
jgi:hypothetical protein